MQNFCFNPTEYNEKNALRRAANSIGAAYALMLGVSFLIQLVLIFVLLLFGKSINETLLFFEDGVVSWAFQAVLSALMFTLPYILAIKLCGERVSAVAEFKKPKKKLFVPLIMLGIGVCQIGEITANIFAGFSESVGVSPTMPKTEYDSSVYGIILGFLATAVIPALVEEFALRGVVFGLLRRFGEGFALLVSSVIFGLMHGNLVQAPFAFAVGLGLGFVMLKSGSVWTSVTVHFINNAMAVVFEYITADMSMSLANVLYAVYAIVLLVLGTFGFIISTKRDEEFWCLTPSETFYSFKKKLSLFFSSPFIIIALVITVFEMILVQVVYR